MCLLDSLIRQTFRQKDHHSAGFVGPLDSSPDQVVLHKTAVTEVLDKLLTFGIARQLLVQQELLDGLDEMITVLSSDQLSRFPADCCNYVSGQVVCRHLRPLLITDVKIVFVHIFL